MSAGLSWDLALITVIRDLPIIIIFLESPVSRAFSPLVVACIFTDRFLLVAYRWAPRFFFRFLWHWHPSE